MPALRPIPRRDFLRGASATSLAALLGGGGLLLTACDPQDLVAPDANGLKLQDYFTSRVIATTGQTVPGTGYTWHADPDGGACFALPGGGWSYVSNCESGSGAGGVGFVEFDANAQIVNAGSTLTGTSRNCGGGVTPWGTWLSGEEWSRGALWECDPLGNSAAVERPLMGLFRHEAAAADETNQVLYLTEDHPSGGLYRFVPTTWGDLSAGVLQILTESGTTLSWQTVPDPLATTTPTRGQVANTKVFNGGEGCDMSNGNLLFTTKGDNRVWKYDPAANQLEIIYDLAVSSNGLLSGADNLETSSSGVAYVAEDGGNMQIVLVREDGGTFPVVELTGVTGSEITGPAFDPSGTRLYFSSQRNPGRTYEVEGPWNVFTEPGPPPPGW